MADDPATDVGEAPENSEAAAHDERPPATGASGARGASDPRGHILESIAPLLGANHGSRVMSEIKEQRRLVSAEKRRLTQQMRNERKKKARLVSRSSRLSNMDLIDVLRLRQEKNQKQS